MELLDRIDEYVEKPITESILDFLSTIELDDLSKEQIKYLDEIFDYVEEDDFINEKTKRVVRNKKRVRKKVCKAGYKAVDGKCKKMSAQEKRSRKKGAKRGARKKVGKSSTIERKRKKSMKRR